MVDNLHACPVCGRPFRISKGYPVAWSYDGKTNKIYVCAWPCALNVRRHHFDLWKGPTK